MIPTIRHIKAAVCEVYGISMHDLVSQSRMQYLVRARTVAYRLCDAAGVYSTTQMGMAFGGRDHSSVWHTMRREMTTTDADRYSAIYASLFSPIVFRSRRGQQ